jgi:hypothetical protein
MKQFLSDALRELDELLRGNRTRPQELTERGFDVRARRMAITITLLCMLYGVCMGTFSLLKETPPTLNDPNGRYLQVLASTLKTPALFFLTLLVTLPSLYVSNALVGSRLSAFNLIKLVVASLGVNAAVLASLGPIVAFFSVSTDSHAFIVLLNVAAFTVAGVLGLAFLLQTLHRLSGSARPASSQETTTPIVEFADGVEVDTQPVTEPSAIDMPEGEVLGEHTRLVFRCWVVLFALVGAQMGWVLRPFIGRPELPFQWFRERHSNFFAAVLRSIGELLLGPGGLD